MIQQGPTRQPRTEDETDRLSRMRCRQEAPIIDDRSEQHNRDQMITKKERKVAKTIAPFVLLALIIATLVTAFFTRRWEFLLALLVFVPYLFLISAPLWLGASTKVAQDENQRERGSNPPR